MEKEEIKIDDWHRLLIGDNPWGFTIEVLGRTIIIYFCLVVVLRLLGKRMNAQLTILDLAVMLTLGAIASVPMQAFDRGILPGVILLVSILALHRLITLVINRNRKIEILTQGKVTPLVVNGIIDTNELKKIRISQEQLFTILRFKGVRHLGEVKRMYSEADGHFSLYRFRDPRPGLSVLPKTDQALPRKENQTDGVEACTKCGNVVEHEVEKPCRNCGNNDWEKPTQS